MYIKLNSIRRLAISVMAFFAMTISCLYAQESAVRITGREAADAGSRCHGRRHYDWYSD